MVFSLITLRSATQISIKPIQCKWLPVQSTIVFRRLESTASKPSNGSTADAQVTAPRSAWRPKKRLSREAMEDLRAQSARLSANELAAKFNISYEAVRRILKSKFTPTKEIAERQERNRYNAMAERQRQFRKQEGSKQKPSSTSTDHE